MSNKNYFNIECLGSDPSQILALIRFAENILDLEVVEATAFINDQVVKLTECKEGTK